MTGSNMKRGCRLLYNLIGAFLAALLVFSGCESGSDSGEAKKTSAEKASEEAASAATKSVYYVLNEDTGAELSEKTHDPETVLEHYDNIFVVTNPYGVYIHKDAYKNSDIIGEIPYRGGGNVIEKTTDAAWYCILSGTVKGYVSAGSVETGSLAEEISKEWAGERVRILTDTDVYGNAEQDEVIASASAGEVYDLILETDCYEIRISSDVTGYIPKETAEQGLFLSEAAEKSINPNIICINPLWSNDNLSGEEPIGPDTSKTVEKYGKGSVGVESEAPEYAVNLLVSQAIKEELEACGYKVILTREGNSSGASRAERLNVAEENGAGIILNIACRLPGEDFYGMKVMAATTDNPYISADYVLTTEDLAYRLDMCLDETMGEAEICSLEYTDELPEINYFDRISVFLELGDLSRAEEDRRLNTADYRKLIAVSVRKAFDSYYGVTR